MDTVWNARGYMLLVYRTGLITLTYTNASGAQSHPWSYGPTTATTNSVRDIYGIQLEIRTFNGSPRQVEIWADGNPLTVDGNGDPAPITLDTSDTFADADAQHLGLIAYTTNAQNAVSGEPCFVRFGDREVFNVGTQTTVTAAPQSDGSMITTILVGPAGGVSEKRVLYSATQVAFLDPTAAPGSGYDTAKTETPIHTLYQGPAYSGYLSGEIVGGSSPLNDLIYVGASGGGIGLCCVPDTVTITGGVSVPAHTDMLVGPQGGPQQPLLHINGLPNYSNYTGPWSMDSVSVKARWYPFKA